MDLRDFFLIENKREFLISVLFAIFILSYSLLIEFNNYKNLTKFDTNIVEATVLKYYKKENTKKILKLKASRGFVFYTIVKKPLHIQKGTKIKMEIWTKKINFYNYMSSFFTFSKIISIEQNKTIKQKLNTYISTLHKDKNITQIYQALYTATPLNKEMQSKFSALGISHLIAISGFHLGILVGFLYLILKPIYKLLQNKFFPYRNSDIDLFFISSFFLLFYMIFLDTPASLLRAFSMLIVGFFIYIRGFRIISMQTLYIASLILLSFFPRLFFSLGFWLSVAGVYYIYLFLLYFKTINKIYQFFLLPIWIYLMMLPHSLYIFKLFSNYHPLSIIWSILFSIFYPLSIFLHLIQWVDLLDNLLKYLINIQITPKHTTIQWYIEILFLLLSLLAAYKKIFMWLLLGVSLFCFLNIYL